MTDVQKELTVGREVAVAYGVYVARTTLGEESTHR